MQYVNCLGDELQFVVFFVSLMVDFCWKGNQELQSKTNAQSFQMRHAVFVPVLNWKHSCDTLWHNLKQTCLALHKQSKPENNPLSYKGGTSFWFPLHLQEYCYFTVGEVVFVLNRSHFSRSWWLPGSLFPRLATFPYQSNFVKRLLIWLYIKSHVRFCVCRGLISRLCA